MLPALPALRLALVVATPLVLMAGLGATVERVWPGGPRRAKAGVNLTAWAALFLGGAVATPALGGIVTAVTNASGGGLIALPKAGLGWWAGLAAYFLAMDLGEYLFHRAQHKIPALWAMHSLHHSDRSFDASTASRHFWLEPAIKTVTVWLAVGLLLKTPPSVTAVYVAVSYWHFMVHSNCRLDLGRFSWALNGPAYHRLHHSRAAEHFDINFASLFPVFDVLSGAYRRPTRGQVVQTGLDTGEEPLGPLLVLAWPVRGWAPRFRRRVQAAA